MTRRRVNAIPLVVDVDGVEIHASLRRQRGKAGNFQVRWPRFGRNEERSTGVNSLEEAKRVARRIIRGESVPSLRSGSGMTVKEFEKIQSEYHLNNGRPEAGKSTLSEFMGIWKSFQRVCPVKTIQEVTEKEAARYLQCLKGMSRTENRNCKTKSTKTISIKTIQKHIRTLAAAWNRVREGHTFYVGGLDPQQLVQANPWEGIRRRVPEDPGDFEDVDPVQFDLANNDLGQFLDEFSNHPVGELFIITSLWCWGRINEMTRMEWSWIQGNYVVIPRAIGKKGRGKVAKLPPSILERLKAIRDTGSPHVFARWVDDVKRNARHSGRIQPFAPSRMMNQMEKMIDKIAEAIGRPEISHHALRRTAMEWGEEAELRQAEKTSAEKLQTTVGNKRQNYTKRLGKKAFTLADGIYENLTVAFNDFPNLAKRLGCEPIEILAEREAESQARKLSPLQRQRLAKKLLEGDPAGEDQGVA